VLSRQGENAAQDVVGPVPAVNEEKNREALVNAGVKPFDTAPGGLSKARRDLSTTG